MHRTLAAVSAAGNSRRRRYTLCLAKVNGVSPDLARYTKNVAGRDRYVAGADTGERAAYSPHLPDTQVKGMK